MMFIILEREDEILVDVRSPEMVLSDPIEIRTPVSANNSLQNDKEDDPVADAIITKYHIGKKNIKLAILTVDNEYYAKIDSFNLLTKSDIQNIYIDCHDNAIV